MIDPFKKITATIVAMTLMMTSLSATAWAEDDVDIPETGVSEEVSDEVSEEPSEEISEESGEEYTEEIDISDEQMNGSSQEEVRYLHRSWDGSAVTEEAIATSDYEFITGSTETLSSGVYVVTDNVTNNHRITVTGDVDLILPDGVKFTASKGIMISQLDEDITVEVGGGQVTYSPLNYIQSVLDGDYDMNLKNLVKSLYMYYQEAEAYLASST